MTLTRTLLVTALVGLVALSGCADDPPTGEFSKQSDDLAIDGSVDFTYTAAQDPYGEPTDGQAPSEQICTAADEDPSEQLPRCVPASTEISAMLHSANDPGDQAYALVLVNESGERAIGELSVQDGMFVLETTIEGENLQGAFDSAELRVGDFLYATATTAGGSNAFEIAGAARMVQFSGEYTGNEFMVNITGLQEGVDHDGWLVTVDDETGEKTHAESFSVSNGDVTYQAPEPGNHYQEFHIHVAGTSINAGIATLD